MEKQNQEKIIETQYNNLSENLQRIHRIDEIFFPVLLFLVGITTATIFYLFVFEGNSIFHLLVLYGVAFCILVINYIILHTQHKSFPMKIFYTPEGVGWISHSGKRVFIPWDDIIKVEPIGDYGKILGYGKGEVPDYMLFFKPFPGFTPVSEEVAEKLMMYMVKYKKL